MDGLGVQDKAIGKGPKTRVCYICGRFVPWTSVLKIVSSVSVFRQYGTTSYEIHLKQCKELWVAREELKDPKERKPLPQDPLLGVSSSSDSFRFVMVYVFS
jgi:hypothetical protein